jgi:enamine deaminase RidA (YjgF/YER057c/UK114 family)
MNKSLTILLGVLLAAAAHAADADRSFITPPGADPKTSAPFSNGVMIGGTFYVGGHLGVDPATGKIPAEAEAETRFLMDAVKQSLERGGLTMADLVSVTV